MPNGLPDNGNIFPNTKQRIQRIYGSPIQPRSNIEVYKKNEVKLPSPKRGNSEKYKYNIVQEYDNFSYKIILDTDGATILDLYNKINPNNNDFILFLELNDTYNLNTILRVKVGSDAAKKKDSLFKFFVNQINGQKFQLNAAAVNELLEGIEEPNIIVKIFKSAKNWIAENYIGIKILESIGDFLEDGLIPAIEKFHLDERRWKASASEFLPLLPIHDILKLFSKDKEKGIEELITKSKGFLHARTSELRSGIQENLHEYKAMLEAVKLYTPMASLTTRVYVLLDEVDKKVDELSAYIKKVFSSFLGGAEAFIKCINAYLCGVWNSIVDMVRGIAELLLLFNKASIGLIKTKDSLNYYSDMAIELFENLRETYLKASFKEMVSATFSKAQELFSSVLYNVKTGKLKLVGDKLVQIAYFCGYAIGTAVTIAIEFIYTGGTAAVADIAARVSRIIAGTGAKIRRLAELSKEAIKKGSEIIQFVREFISNLLALVKKDPKLLINKFIDILNKIGIAIKKELGLVDEILVSEDQLLAFAKTQKLNVVLQDIKTIIKITRGRKDLAENILLSTREIIEGKTISELVVHFKIKNPPISSSLSNYQTRIWYKWRKLSIESEIIQLTSLESKAKKAFALRNEFRTLARKYMKDRELAKYLEDVEKNMKWSDMLNRVLLKEDINSLEMAYQNIIRSSSKGRDEIDDLFRIII